MRKFRIDPVSLIVWVWLFFALGFQYALSYFFAIVVHELGHYFVAKRLGYKLNLCSVSVYGVSLSYLDEEIDHKDEFKIAIAGPIANLVFVLLTISIWWIFPDFYFFSVEFVQIGMVLALINLLPCYPLDGGRMFVSLSSKFLSSKTSKKLTMIFNLIFATLFFVLFLIFCFINFNPSYCLFAVFLFAGSLDLQKSCKYDKINLFSKKGKNFVKPTIICVYEDVTIRELIKKTAQSKTIVFCLILENGKTINISEKLLIKLSLNFSLDTTLKDIF